jgi:hypothetical protein
MIMLTVITSLEERGACSYPQGRGGRLSSLGERGAGSHPLARDRHALIPRRERGMFLSLREERVMLFFLRQWRACLHSWGDGGTLVFLGGEMHALTPRAEGGLHSTLGKRGVFTFLGVHPWIGRGIEPVNTLGGGGGVRHI